MKRFMYLSIGLLCIAITLFVGFYIGHSNANAGVVTPPVGNIVSMYAPLVVTATDGIWVLRSGPPEPYWEKWGELPVPIDQVQFYEGNYVVDKSGDVWAYGLTGDDWKNWGQPPLLPVGTDPASWGKLKSEYRKEN